MWMREELVLQLRRIKGRCLGVDLIPCNHNIKTRCLQNSQIKQVWKYWTKFIYKECTGDKEAYKGEKKHPPPKKNKKQ